MEHGVLKIVNHANAGFEHVIICLTGVDTTAPAIHPDCEVVELQKAAGNDWRIPGRIAAVARRARLDVLHARGWPTLLETAVAARLAGVEGTVYSFHGRTIQELQGIPRRRRWVQRVVVPRYRQIVTLNPRMRQDFASECQIPEARITIVPNGVDTNRFAPRPKEKAQLRERFGVPRDRLVVGTVARLDAVKNHELILRATRRCLDDGLPLFVLVAGEGSHRPAIEAAIEGLGLTDDVRLLGHSAHVPEILNCLDVYVQTSLYEGFSNTLLEAMASGVPVIATDVGGTADLFDANREGWLFPSGDATALADLIRRARGERLRVDMAARARERVVTRYSLRAMVEQYEALYEGLSERQRLPIAVYGDH
jgi:sugar transferase (PEP-CTERM/EpsH1 system associated)